MRWRNSNEAWGAIAIALHWLTALTVIFMFGLGLYMTGLDYYDPWYRKGPDLHRSIGVLLFIVVVLRLLWRLVGPVPAPIPEHKPWEHLIAATVHVMLYILLLALMISGYLITTADGSAIEVFGWFNVPATLTGEHQEDYAGAVHLFLAWTVIGLALLHAAAALKHHFIDRDRTLRRMLGL